MFDPQDRGQDFRLTHKLGERFIALYAGAHGISNDLDILLRAAALLRDRPDILIVLIGDGKEKPRLVEEARKQKLDNICFLPPISKKEMSHALAAADACVAILKRVSLYATVYPNKVFDYMAAGRPVILAIPGVIRELVEEVGAGMYVEPGDPAALAQAIAYLADHPEERIRMGENGRRCIETSFDRPLLADKLAKLIAEMVNRL
jgi:glycosyltransferase involved in cell wall biosynthesis